MKRCEACGNTDQSMFERFNFAESLTGSSVRAGWRCVKCSRVMLDGEADREVVG